MGHRGPEPDAVAPVDALLRPSEYQWDRTGPSKVHAHVTQPVVQQLDRFGARSVLDLGCGNGWFTEALTRCGFDAAGADVSRSGVAVARAAYPEVAFRQFDAMQTLPVDWHGHFDAVVAIELLDHVALPRAALRQALAALKPGGLFVATTPFHGYFKNLGLALTGRLDRRWQALRDHGRVKFYSAATLTALLAEAGLQDLHFETIGRVPLIARSMLVAGRLPLEHPHRPPPAPNQP
jgi:2-polyprenyl-6-hydroxyphenyl methylase/3-demethylubiquinone-9 3-methyltransferase